MVETLIEQFLDGVSGQLSDRNRVIDLLLDLRLAAADRPAVRTEVDRLLADVPGLTTVENDWLRTALAGVSTAAAAVPTA
ncbi:MAG: hypothetical protein AAF531_01110 [Actinomycetota bacterium]